MNKFVLTDNYMSFLFYIRYFQVKTEVVDNIFTSQVAIDLLKQKYIQIVNDVYYITSLGDTNFKTAYYTILYPLSKNDIMSFNQTIKSMTPRSKEALICAQINNKGFDITDNNVKNTMVSKLVELDIICDKLNPDLINKIKQKIC